MIRIIDGRGTGKTSRLMLLAKEHNALFVCENPDAMQVKAEAYGITGLQFVSYYDYLRFQYETDKENIVIDELEVLLKHMLNGHLVGYTLSNND